MVLSAPTTAGGSSAARIAWADLEDDGEDLGEIAVDVTPAAASQPSSAVLEATETPDGKAGGGFGDIDVDDLDLGDANAARPSERDASGAASASQGVEEAAFEDVNAHS